MKVIAKNPGEPFREMEVDNTLEALQAFVQGYIETVTLFTDMCIICNEEGAIKGMPFNVEHPGHSVLRSDYVRRNEGRGVLRYSAQSGENHSPV